MTEQNIETVETTEVDTIDTPELETTEVDNPEDTQPDESKEAAKYRRRLRETEKERDQLAEQLDTLRRQVIEQIAGDSGRLRKPEALWKTSITVADLLDESGRVDSQKVIDASKSAVAELGLAEKRPGNFVPREGNNPRVGMSDNWTGAFTPK